MNRTSLLNILSGQDRSPAASLTRIGLGCATPAYRLAVTARNQLFDAGIRQPARLGRPTISVGNLTTGGTGKTPMVIHLVQRLIGMRHAPAVLTRGYRGGDEADQMRAELGGAVPVEANPNRAAGAAAVLQTHPRTTVFVLDDGFQHRQVHRDLDLVLIDATDPFGHDRLLPRGLLREPPIGLRRADAVIVTRAEQVTPQVLANLNVRINDLTGKPPLVHAAMRWSALRSPAGEHPPDVLRTARVLGVCGIGNPAPFERMLRSIAGDLVDMRVFPDHHGFADRDWQDILRAAASADAIVMTEKDWVKLRELVAHEEAARIYRPVLALEFAPSAAPLDTLIRDMLAHDLPNV